MKKSSEERRKEERRGEDTSLPLLVFSILHIIIINNKTTRARRYDTNIILTECVNTERFILCVGNYSLRKSIYQRKIDCILFVRSSVL